MTENPRRFGLSRLRAYELVRTVERRLAKERKDSPIHKEASALKKRFERLRMPLAKFETARNYPVDWPMAYPDINESTRALGWRVSKHEFIERRQLGDALLEFLEQLANAHHSAP